MHFVYFLHCPESGDLLYVGRSINPKNRLYAFKREKGVDAVLGVCKKYESIEDACASELEAIARLRPPYNKILVSSKGGLGYKHSEHAKTAIGSKNKGLVRSEEAREAMRQAALGRPGFWTGKKLPPETIEKLRKVHTGRINSPETLHKMRLAALKRWSTKNAGS